MGHGRVTMFDDFERLRPATLDGVAQPVQRTDTRVSAPREHQPARNAHTDHLIVNEIGSHPYQGQIPATLANDLVPGGERELNVRIPPARRYRRRGRAARSPRKGTKTPLCENRLEVRYS